MWSAKFVGTIGFHGWNSAASDLLMYFIHLNDDIHVHPLFMAALLSFCRHNIPIPIRYPALADEGLWGGEGVVECLMRPKDRLDKARYIIAT